MYITSSIIYLLVEGGVGAFYQKFSLVGILLNSVALRGILSNNRFFYHILALRFLLQYLTSLSYQNIIYYLDYRASLFITHTLPAVPGSLHPAPAVISTHYPLPDGSEHRQHPVVPLPFSLIHPDFFSSILSPTSFSHF